MNRNGATAAEQMLQSIRENVTSEDPLFAAHAAARPAGGYGPGFSDLFLLAAAPESTGGKDHLLALEYTWEGYLLHYGNSRLLKELPDGLALLAGDYMYARGLDHLTSLGDLDGIRLLSELISFCSLVHCEGLDPELAAAAWAITALEMAKLAGGGAAGASLPGSGGDDLEASLQARLDELIAGHPGDRADALRDELCNIYDSFNQQRRRDGTG
ncbi:MAG: hypothetical protein ACYCXJ_09775 [Thermoleophilia bacterium]